MKKIIYFSIMLFSHYSFSQVGIGTNDPKTTLDVLGLPTDTTIADGITAPRISGTNLKAKDGSYGSDQIGAIVYVTEALTSSDTSTKTANITTIGYYYFDGSVWNSLKSGSNENIYNTDGTLTENRTVSQEDYTLNFTGNKTNGFNVGSNTLSVDMSNNRVGINTIAPKGALDISSTTLGVALPTLTNTQRDNIAVGSRPAGTLIYNTSISRLEVNTGTDDIPIWTALGELTSSSTINTTLSYSASSTQTFNTTGEDVKFDLLNFTNIPSGYVTESSTTQFKLSKGKAYRITYDTGSVTRTTVNSLNCNITSSISGVIARARPYPTTFEQSNPSGPSNATGYSDLTNSSSDDYITVNCYTGGGTATIATTNQTYRYPLPTISITILN